MPLIKVTNLDSEKTVAVAKNIKGELSKATKVDENLFSFFHCGGSTLEESPVLIEILTYARDPGMLHSIAEILSGEVKKHRDCHVNVIFSDLTAEKHFMNGEQVKFK
jgi:hypothetical protein